MPIGPNTTIQTTVEWPIWECAKCKRKEPAEQASFMKDGKLVRNDCPKNWVVFSGQIPSHNKAGFWVEYLFVQIVWCQTCAESHANG